MLAMLAAVALLQPAEAAPFLPPNLAGWKALPDLWSFKGGELVGSSGDKGLKFNTFLVSEKEYGNFQLSFAVKLTGASANSGVQFRSSILNQERLAVKGPQADIGMVYWGSLFGEHHAPGDKHVMLKQCDWKQVGPTIKKDDFNRYSIRCVGQHVTIQVNGVTTVDGDFPTLPDKGRIAFQLHGGPPMRVAFKDIQFKELPAE